jgi:hypothetical protein
MLRVTSQRESRMAARYWVLNIWSTLNQYQTSVQIAELLDTIDCEGRSGKMRRSNVLAEVLEGTTYRKPIIAKTTGVTGLRISVQRQNLPLHCIS